MDTDDFVISDNDFGSGDQISNDGDEIKTGKSTNTERVWKDAVNSDEEAKPKKQNKRAKKVIFDDNNNPIEGQDGARVKKPRKAKEVNNPNMIKTSNKLIGSI